MLDQEERLDGVFRALSDSGRRRMLDRLIEGPASVSDLAQPMPMTLAAVVQHVQVLETTGLIVTEKVGRVRTCRIVEPALREVEQWIAERRELWETRFDRLGEILAEHHQDDHNNEETS